MAVWSWGDVDWGPNGPPDHIRTRLSPVGPRPKDGTGKPARDDRPRKPRFRLTEEGARQAVVRLCNGESAAEVAIAMRVPEAMIESTSRRAGPHDCPYGCGPTGTVPVGPAHAEEDRMRQRVRCTCDKRRCWMRVTVRDRT